MFKRPISHDNSTKQATNTEIKNEKLASSLSSLNSPNISSEQLRELLEVANLPVIEDLLLPDPCNDKIESDLWDDLPSPKAISLETLRFLVKEISDQSKPNASDKFKIWKITEDHPTTDKAYPPICISENVLEFNSKTKSYTDFEKPEQRKKSFGLQKSYSLDIGKAVTPENGLRNYRLKNYKPKLHNSSSKFENLDIETSSSHTLLEEKLKELTEGNNLEKWLESLNLPQRNSIDSNVVRKQIHEYFKFKSQSEETEDDDSLLKKFWSKVKGKNKSKGKSFSKQSLIIIGGLVAYVSVTAVTAELLPLVWPAVLGIGTVGEEALVDIGVEFFQQIPDPAYNLLHSHAQNAKPLTYACANQYILWKYMK